MRAEKDIPISKKYMPNNPKIQEDLDEENISNSSSLGNREFNYSSENKYNKNSKNSKVYFYCPYNQSYTKFQHYNIENICELIKKYQLENYFIIQIDNDNMLYEEILKMQFINESQVIHKMFDLKLDYSFSPFQDTLFFNMSILTDFFYDQIEKYMIQIFFHNHGICIINKDSCESIHQILMEKFIFYYVDNSEFFDKSIYDKNNKYKSTKILINDFKLKNIIQKFQEDEQIKTQKKNVNVSRSFVNLTKQKRKNGSLRDGGNCSYISKYRKMRISTPDPINNFNKNNKINNRGTTKLCENRSLNNLNEKIPIEKKSEKDSKKKKSKNLHPDENYKKTNFLKKNINEKTDDILLKESVSQIQFNNIRYYDLFNELNQENYENSGIANFNHNITCNNEAANSKYSINYSELEINNNYNNNITKDEIRNTENIITLNPLIDNYNNQTPTNKSDFIDIQNINQELYTKMKIRIKKDNIGANKTLDGKIIKQLNNDILAESEGSSISSKNSFNEREENEKNNTYHSKQNFKSKFNKLLFKDSLNKGERDNDSERSFSQNNLKNFNKKENEFKDSNRRNSEENIKLIKIFTFKEENENKKCQDNSILSEKKMKEHSYINRNYWKNPNLRQTNRRFSDKRSHNFDFIDVNFKDYQEFLKMKFDSVNNSHINFENYSKEVVDIGKKFNKLSHNENELNHYDPKLFDKQLKKEDSNSYNPLENDKKFTQDENECIIMNSKNGNYCKNSEENRLILNKKENQNDVNNKEMAKVRDHLDNEEFNKKKTFCRTAKKKSSKNSQHKRINFSTDELIYYLFVFSLEKLEEFTESLVKEADSLKGIYLELSEKERKDFFRRIHSMEVSMHIIHQETKIKKKFFKYAKNQFRTYNKLSNDFYFKNNFNFLLELMISKITQIELTFDTLEDFLKMIKENYLIIIEDNTEKENVKLNYVMKVLTILTTIYAPMNIIPGLFGMNVKVPWVGSEVDSTDPFIYICVLLLFLILIQLYAFKKLKWL